MVVGDQHFTHFFPLHTAVCLSEEKEDGSQHPVHGTCSWTVADPTSPPQTPPPPPPNLWQHLKKRRELALKTLDLNGIEKKKVEEWGIRFKNNE